MTESMIVPTAMPSLGAAPRDADLRTRWQPARAGLVNAWRYQDEVLGFHRGRLLLRGPNGSGKSMALELLLPFLLDGNASQHRLTSAAKARGGLYDRLLGEDRSAGSKVAFLWVEFRRAGADGPETCTIGVRLRASASTRQVDKLWFVTPQTIGAELELLDAGRVPLAAAALTEVVEAGGGHTFDDAATYRSRVRETLFPAFSPDQYDALISALLVLRQEKLSQHLDVERLSATLSAALPGLDEREVAEAAEGFRQLDQRRENLAQLDADVAAVSALRQRQRAYARAELRNAAASVISSQSERDGAVRRRRGSHAQLVEASDRDARLAAEDVELERRVAELAGSVDALRQRDAYREGSTLTALAAEVDRARASAERDAHQRDEAERSRDTRAVEHDEATHRAAGAAARMEEARDQLGATAARLGAGGILEAAAATDPDDAGRLLTAWVDRRREQLETVRRALTTLGERIHRRDDVTEQLDAAGALREERDAAVVAAGEALDAAVSQLRRALTDWVGALAVLPRDPLADLAAAGEDDLDDTPARIAEAAGRVREELAAARARIDRRAEELGTDHAALTAEREAVAGSPTPSLPGPSWRRDRAGLDGAPLWRLLDLQPGVDGDLAAALEAGLTASGLLDAWVQPDGRVTLDGEQADVLAFSTGQPVVDGPTLAAVLRPERQDEVPVAVLDAILSSVALVEHATVPANHDEDDAGSRAASTTIAIGRDGSFRIGTLAGRGPDRPAGYLGATAREQERARQLAALDARLAELEARREQLDRDRDAVDATRAILDAEAAAAPSTRGMTDARLVLTRAEERLADAVQGVDRLRERHAQAEGAVRDAQRALTAAAAEHGLPTREPALAEVARGCQDLDRQAAAWIGRRRQHDSATELVAGREAALLQAGARHQQAAEQAESSTRHHAQLRARLDALEATVGAAYAEVVARIAAAETEQQHATTRRRAIAEERLTLGKQLGRLESELARVEAELATAEQTREQARRTFLAAIRDGFGDDADVEVALERAGAGDEAGHAGAGDEAGHAGADGSSDAADEVGLTAVLEAARDVARVLEGVAHDPQTRTTLQARVVDQRYHAEQQLGGRSDLGVEATEHGWWLLRARLQGIAVTITELRHLLSRELDTARGELADHERDLYDRTLTAGLRRHLVARLRAADELVSRINTQLGKVRTEARVGVQLEWVVDDAPGQEAVRHARPLLLKGREHLQPDEVDALHAFLRARIELVRDPSQDTESSWEGRLLRAFDYRAWHRFRLRISHSAWGGDYRPATSKRLQSLSTGERSVVLHLPMLASIAAHYDASQAAGTDGHDAVGSPRLILLDELFVGVDPTNRAQLFGMFVEWDLDAVLTSDHEWCRYATLDGIAIHQVHADGEVVVTSRFLWDGRRKTAAPVPGPT
jgi:uncharacterized protein (TIGR02680 family)